MWSFFLLALPVFGTSSIKFVNFSKVARKQNNDEILTCQPSCNVI